MAVIKPNNLTKRKKKTKILYLWIIILKKVLEYSRFSDCGGEKSNYH